LGGGRLGGIARGDVGDDLLDAVWDEVLAMHAAGITHGAIEPLPFHYSQVDYDEAFLADVQEGAIRPSLDRAAPPRARRRLRAAVSATAMPRCCRSSRTPRSHGLQHDARVAG
jgi:hypothetical protein